MTEVAGNLARIRERIAAACIAAGRAEDEVRLIAVSKRISLARVVDAYRAGHCDFGENRIQDALPRQEEMSLELQELGIEAKRLRWHFIGNLQSNKARKAVGKFTLIHGVDSVALARRMGAIAVELGIRQPILLQCNTSGEIQKHGLNPDEVPEAVQQIVSIEGLELRGLMTMGRAAAREKELRLGFATLREFVVQARIDTGLQLPELSMGMSQDFEAAIAEGATMVRVGTALFGPRDMG